MPKYYFDIATNEDWTQDDEGLELSFRHEAHRQAINAIAAIAADEIPRDGSLKITVAVKDERRRNVLQTHVWFEPGEE